jgi:protein-S-isoprenylcysteine O-methyltransferase Ste14
MVEKLTRLQTYLSQDFLGGPRLIKLSALINFQKGGTLPLVLTLMYLFNNFSIEAWVYAGLHGSYGICWLIKDRYFPDKRWEVKITLGGAVMSFFLVLGLYWLFPLILISPWFHEEGFGRATWLLGLCILIHTLGMAIMMISDAQKYFTLKYRPGLITEGLFRYTRNPNYLGEMLIYGAYALLAGHWLGWLVLAWVWSVYFSVNMVLKDRSLSRYEGWESYKNQTGILIPKIPFLRYRKK